jgi:hypothetical protein
MSRGSRGRLFDGALFHRPLDQEIRERERNTSRLRSSFSLVTVRASDLKEQ